MRLRPSLGIGLVLYVAAAGTSAAATGHDERQVVLRRANGIPFDAEVDVLLEPAEDAAATRRISSSGRQGIWIPAAFAGRIGCGTEGYWCPWTEVAADEARLVLPLFRSATVAGHVAPGRETSPEALLVEGTVALPGSPDVHFRHRIPVDQRGGFAFEAPRGELDLRLAAAGWAPLYRWAVVVEDREASLGTLRFERGSSVSGFVRHGSAELPLAGAAVRALPASIGDVSEDARRRLEALAERVVSDERGFFQLTGLPPGRYRLEVELEGFFPAGPPVVEVVENSESHLAKPVALFPAAQLTVFVDPPNPAGEGGWRVALVPQSGPHIRQEVTDENGVVEFQRLVPGTYRVEVGSAEHPMVWKEQVDISSDRTIIAELPILELVGKVTLGGEPLIARIEIETGTGDRWRYRSDEEGRFSGILRHPEFDLLFVHLEADEPELSKTLEIRGLEADDGLVEVDLALDDRTVDGTVIDGLGNPVAGADVRVHAADRLVARLTTDENGEFAARALDRDRYTLQAEARGRGSSEVIEADLSAVRYAGPFRLTLVPQERLDGVLRSADGRPVQGAQIEASAWQPAPYADVGRSDLTGRFWISVPEGTRRIHLEIQAPSVGLIAVCANLPSSEDRLEIVLPAIADAAVALDLHTSPNLPPPWIGPLVLVRRGGGFLSVSTLRSWIQANGGSWGDDDKVVPGLAPGEYALAWLDGPSWYQAAAACEPTIRREPAWRPVGPGGILHLRYDLEPHQRAAAGGRSSAGH